VNSDFCHDNLNTPRITKKGTTLHNFAEKSNINLLKTPEKSIGTLFKNSEITVNKLVDVELVYSSGRMGRGVNISTDDGVYDLSNILLSTSFKKKLPHNEEVIKSGFLSFDRFTGGNMCHVIFDHAARAFNFLENYSNADTEVVFIDSAWPWAKDIINLTELRSSFLKPDTVYKFKTLYFASNAFDGQLHHPSITLDNLYLNHLQKIVSEKVCQGKRKNIKLFVGRGNSGIRTIQNESVISKALEGLGYKYFNTAKQTTFEQLKTFSTASEVIILHGAACSNLVACQKDTIVKEIFYPYGTNAYEKLSKAAGFKYKKYLLELKDDCLCSDQVLEIALEQLSSPSGAI
jgi:hypothetical protein